MNHKEIQDLIKLVNRTNLAEFKLEQGDLKITIRTKDYLEGRSPTIIQQAPMVPATTIAAPIQDFTPAAPKSPTISDADTSSKDTSEEESDLIEIKSPMVGTFYRKPSPDKDAFAKVGTVIGVGDTVCVIEAMKLFNEIESEVSGKIVKVLVDDAQPVEYDQPLFLVDPKG